MKNVILIQKRYQDGYQEPIVVPHVARRSDLEQLQDSKVTEVHFALQKTLNRIQHRALVGRDIDNGSKNANHVQRD